MRASLLHGDPLPLEARVEAQRAVARLSAHRLVADDEGVKNARLVYSSDRGRICPTCGWPADNCQCSTANPRDVGVPDRVVAKLRLEKAGRGGKTVTVIYDLPRNTKFLKDLCAELKRGCGTGGAVSDDTVEIQGDHRDRVRQLLQQRGFVVKGN